VTLSLFLSLTVTVTANVNVTLSLTVPHSATPYSSANELLMCAARISFHLCESESDCSHEMMRFKFALMLWVIAF